jgi:putative ABC transport system permease protein
MKIYPSKGRFLNDADDLRRSKVVFVGSSVLDDLEMGQDSVGGFLRIDGEWYRVIGVAESKGEIFGFDQDNYVIVPFSTLASNSGESLNVDIEIHLQPSDESNSKQVTDQIQRLLRKRHSLNASEDNDFEFVNSNKTKESFANVTFLVTSVAIGLVSISLLVGGVGIMNMMLTSVISRTKEIGILKALGAPPLFCCFSSYLKPCF